MLRVMIVDDEAIIRKGIATLVDWHALDCTVVCEAGNGLEAREQLETANPHIVITDVRMPRLNGIELAEYIHSREMGIQVILLTAHADFAYAQSAIQFGVVDFVVKSTDPIGNVQKAVAKAKRKIVQEQEKATELAKNRSEMTETFFKDVIAGVLSAPETIRERMQSLNIQLTNFHMLLFEQDSSSQHRDSSDKQEHFYVSVKNYVAHAFKEYPYYFVCTGRQSFCLLLQTPRDHDSAALKKLQSACEEIAAVARNLLYCTLHIGISRLHNGIDEVSASHHEALQALAARFYDDDKSVYLYGVHDGAVTASFGEKEYIDRIMRNIEAANAQEAIQILNELMERQKTSRQSIERIKNTSILICSLCSKLVDSEYLNHNDIAGSVDDPYPKILQAKSIHAVKEIVKNRITAVSGHLCDSAKMSNDLINKAMAFIKENYNKPLGLQQVADHVHVNSSYLSRLFSKETGSTFIDVINKLRIEKAKELLLNTNLKTFEVANEVGIQDSTYFIRLFKKYTNQRPQDYKRQ